MNNTFYIVDGVVAAGSNYFPVRNTRD